MSRDDIEKKLLSQTSVNQDIAAQAFKSILEIHTIKRDVIDLKKEVDQSSKDIDSLKTQYNSLDTKLTITTTSIESKLDKLSVQIQPVLSDSKLFQTLKTLLMIAGAVFVVWAIGQMSVDELVKIITKKL